MKKYYIKDKCTKLEFSCDSNFLDNDNDHSVYIIDKNVYRLFQDRFDRHISEKQLFLFEASEANKNLDSIDLIYTFFHKNNVNRSSRIFGIGGGITTDITAFAASTYMRGCRLQLVPTTFLSMIDSAIGGKTALNFRGVKNNLGTFYPAEVVYICTSFIKTLPQIEKMNGWAEAVKIALINKSDIYEEILNSGQVISASIIEKAIDLKFRLCTIDPEDRKERRILNLGHTFGHIIEKVTDFSTPHGIAVAVGIRAAAKLSLSESLISSEESRQIDDFLNMFDFPEKLKLPEKSFGIDLINKTLHRDKKTSYTNKKLSPNVVVFNGFQQAVVLPFPVEKIYKALSEVVELF